MKKTITINKEIIEKRVMPVEIVELPLYLRMGTSTMYKVEESNKMIQASLGGFRPNDMTVYTYSSDDVIQGHIKDDERVTKEEWIKHLILFEKNINGFLQKEIDEMEVYDSPRI